MSAVKLVKAVPNTNSCVAVDFKKPDDFEKVTVEGNDARAVNGTVMASVLYDGKYLTLALPPLMVAFDPSSYLDSKKINVDLDLRHATSHSTVKEAFDVLRGIDERVAQQVVKQREKLVPGLKKTGPLAKSDQSVHDCYVFCTRPRVGSKSDAVWPPRLSATLSGARILGEDQNINKGDVVRCVVQTKVLCNRAEKVTLSWRILQLRKIRDGLPYPDISLTEQEAFGISLSSEGDGATKCSMDLTEDLV